MAPSGNEKRERWLNPPEWIEQVAAKVDGADTFEDVPAAARALIRQSAIMAAAAKDSRLKKRTLTNLYNERPTWLKLAHETLDRAVLAAYAAVDPSGGWEEDWAEVWTETGAGKALPLESALRARRAEVDSFVLSNLLRLNQARAGGSVPKPSSASNIKLSVEREKPIDDEKVVKALAEYRDKLRALYGDRLDRVVLFGSRARGNARPGSDADLLVVLRGKLDYDKELERTSKITADLSRCYSLMIGRGFMNKTNADSPNGLLQANIRLEGVIL